MAKFTKEETWQTLCVFSINGNSKMFYCKEMMVSTDSNNTLHTFLIMECQYNRKLALACGLVSIPCSRLTFDRRLKTMFTDVKGRISTMEYLFITERLAMIDYYSITAIDRVLC
jgi:hypothetical protein